LRQQEIVNKDDELITARKPAEAEPTISDKESLKKLNLVNPNLQTSPDHTRSLLINGPRPRSISP
jgi:hypothetical protein